MNLSKTGRKERKIRRQIDQLQKEGYRLSRIDRQRSMNMYAEAEKLTEELIALRNA